MDWNFRHGDCDYIGGHRYKREPTKTDFEVTEAQIRLFREGMLKAADVDGFVGSGTLDALKRFYDRAGKVAGAPDVQGRVVLENVPHISQGSGEVADVLLGNHAGADRCQRYGCMSCALWCILTYHGAVNSSCAATIGYWSSQGCYDNSSVLNQPRACEVFGFLYDHEQAHSDALECLDNRQPVILRVPGKSSQHHFVVGIGYDDEAEKFAVHDVGQRVKNFYVNEQWVDYDIVTRIDTITPA